MAITFTQEGDFKNIEGFLNRAKRKDFFKSLQAYGQEGVRALAAATPVDTGKTAASWYYEVEITKDHASITWRNDNSYHSVPIVVLIQYGHATKNGGFVQGRDFINPTMQPIFDSIAKRVWSEVSK